MKELTITSKEIAKAKTYKNFCLQWLYAYFKNFYSDIYKKLITLLESLRLSWVVKIFF